MYITKNIQEISEEKFTAKPDFREKLLKFGAENLKDEELIAILLRTGIKGKPVTSLSNNIIKHIDKNNLDNISTVLHNIKGMGASKTAVILAAFELGKRYYKSSFEKISCPSDIVPFLQHYSRRKQENFICASLNGANEILRIRVITVGILTRTLVHPREVFSDVLKDRAASIIVAHNHPSGNPKPSHEDIVITRNLFSAGCILGVNLLDHIILTPRNEFFSFVQNGIPLGGKIPDTDTGAEFITNNYSI